MVDVDLTAITDEYDALNQEIKQKEFEINQYKKRQERLQLMMMAVLNQADVEEMEFNGYKFGLKTVTRKALDQKLLASEQPDIFEKYKVEKTSERFDFKIMKAL